MVPFVNETAAVLRSVLSSQEEAFIVVDALDEYRLGDGDASLSLVRHLQSLDVRLLLTSRSPVSTASIKQFITVTVSPGEEDVRAYVQHRTIDRLADNLSRVPTLLEEILPVVLEKSKGRYVASLQSVPTSIQINL